MKEVKAYVGSLLSANRMDVSANRTSLFEDFVESQHCKEAVITILEKQREIMEKWHLKNRIFDIVNQQIVVPNATIGKAYEAKLDFERLNLTDLILKDFEGLNEIGLNFNTDTNTIEGIPSQSGDLKFKLIFKLDGESADAAPNEKLISLVVNPDPKTLWKDIPSDTSALFWKEDNASIATKFGEKNIVVSSKRGRSHKNVGSFREDDFAIKHFQKTGWSVVAISDGAGSYSLSRKGSQLACAGVIEYFEHNQNIEKAKEFEIKLAEYNSSPNEALLKDIEILAKQNLYKASLFAHNKIKEHSEKTFESNPELFNNPKAKSAMDYYHATLIFSLFKKYDFGYVVLTFGVGDCPIAVMNKEQTETTLMNWLDVGEHGGGTRFITEPDIFTNAERPIITRFNFKIISDFSYLFLMTDGIYDAKFVVEANLENHDKWMDFLADLGGDNEDKSIVHINPDNSEIAEQLSAWMDFWSSGNHDDRTLAIIY